MQSGVVVHAADHSFHHEDALCVMFQTAEHHKYSLQDVPVTLFSAFVYLETLGEITTPFLSIFIPSYLSRGPPVVTV